MDNVDGLVRFRPLSAPVSVFSKACRVMAKKLADQNFHAHAEVHTAANQRSTDAYAYGGQHK